MLKKKAPPTLPNEKLTWEEGEGLTDNLIQQSPAISVLAIICSY
jgi:hypothetical protein